MYFDSATETRGLKNKIKVSRRILNPQHSTFLLLANLKLSVKLPETELALLDCVLLKVTGLA